MSQPLISFIIPVYGAEKYLERCVQSVLAQGTEDWELILVDDESPDASGEICEKFAKQDERIRVVHKKNGGPGAARNTGVSLATGKWLMFVDADDWLDEDMCTECVPYLTDDIDILTFCRREIRNRFVKDCKIGLPMRTLTFKTKNEIRALQINVISPYKSYKYVLYNGFFGSPWAKFVRRSLWQENQLTYVESACGEDRPPFLKAYGCAKKVLHIDSCYYNYLIHGESTMRKYLEDAYVKCNLSVKTIHEYVHTNMSDSEESLEALRHLDIEFFSHYVVQDYCNRLNPQSYSRRKERFQHDIQKYEFREAFKRANLSCLPLRRRILAMLIRGEKFFLINFMCKVNNIWNKFMYKEK